MIEDYEAKAPLAYSHARIRFRLNKPNPLGPIVAALVQAAADGKEAALKETYERIGDAALASAFDAGAAEMRERCLSIAAMIEGPRGNVTAAIAALAGPKGGEDGN